MPWSQEEVEIVAINSLRAGCGSKKAGQHVLRVSVVRRTGLSRTVVSATIVMLS